ncbi:hypothetical protein RFI_18515, partial [Reticulomyxa filosa]
MKKIKCCSNFAKAVFPVSDNNSQKKKKTSNKKNNSSCGNDNPTLEPLLVPSQGPSNSGHTDHNSTSKNNANTTTTATTTATTTTTITPIITSIITTTTATNSHHGARSPNFKDRKKLVLFLGGSERKHQYLANEFLKYSKSRQKHASLYTLSKSHAPRQGSLASIGASTQVKKGKSSDHKDKIFFESLSTGQCHEYGPHMISSYLQSQQYQVVAVCPSTDNLIPFTD